MATDNIGNLQHRFNDDDRPSGIPRRGHLGVATSELVMALIAFTVLVLLFLAFYLSAR